MSVEKIAVADAVASFMNNITVSQDLNYAAVEHEREQMTNNSSQKLFVIRHGERLDFVFRNWIDNCFNDDGKYIRNNLNMPLTLPDRKLGVSGYISDPPLTRIGIYQSFLVGEGLKNANIEIEHVFCSPAFRCIQTCDAVLHGLGRKNLKIKLEPGLYEWLAAQPQHAQPDFLSTDELINAGYNIDKSYSAFTPRNLLLDTNETFTQFQKRKTDFARSMSSEYTTGNILCVAHTSTIKMFADEFTGKSITNAQELLEKVKDIPYCGFLTLSKNSDIWDVIKTPSFSVTHGKNQQFNYQI